MNDSRSDAWNEPSAQRIQPGPPVPARSVQVSPVQRATLVPPLPLSRPPLTRPRRGRAYAAGSVAAFSRSLGTTECTTDSACIVGGAHNPGLSHSDKRPGSLGGGVLVSRTYTHSPSSEVKKLFPASLAWGLESLSVGALLDSGADECLIDVSLARQAGIPLEPLDVALSAQALDGQSLGKITHRTVPLSLTLSGNHVETIQFIVLYAPTAPLVLGRPWLDKHDPHVSWSSGRILGWSVACHADCLRSASSPPSGAKPTLSPPVLTGIPPAYHDLTPVFSKESALSLPPHRPYDWAIDLLPGAPLPVGRLYNLSIPKKEVMRNYITKSVASGIIRPSSSPVAAGFFFVAKKDSSLRPCIDYRQLNTITVKNKYPIPLLSSTFEPLTHATVFTKLDLRNA